ncbi:MAG: putative transposase [Desulforhopalus sp.]|jgi:putative transposase
MAIESIALAVRHGARQQQACKIIDITVRTLQYWRVKGLEDQRQTVTKKPANKLREHERNEVLEICNSKEFMNASPKQIVPTLADKGKFIASESTFYRILRAANQLHHRGRTAKPNSRKRPEPYTANGPSQLWSWDITYLASTIKGRFFYLYLFMDIYSRKIVGWEVYENESSEQAADVLRKTRLKEALPINHDLVLHSDNGGPMKGATMLSTMQKMGVVPSFSRPSVSNDNPFSEALFKTLKYVPVYPTKPFDSVVDARQWVSTFCRWYNYSHRHSGLKFVTPVQRHNGKDGAILEGRKRVYEAAKQLHPERWSGKIRNWNHETTVELNPVNQAPENSEDQIAA